MSKKIKIFKFCAIICLSIALLFQTIELILDIRDIGFFLETLFAYLFELITCIFIIFSISTARLKLLEIALIVLKTFEGTFYPLRSSQRIDMIIKDHSIPVFYITNHIIFAVASGLILISLIVFCIYKVNDKFIYWKIMKICILIACITMLLSGGSYIASSIMGETPWDEIIEPLSLATMFFGIYSACNYVEGVSDEKKISVA